MASLGFPRFLSTRLLCALALGGAATLTLVGCPSDATTTVVTPVTGIVIRSDALTEGYGCGTGVSQVYKYAAVVINQDGALVTGSVSDCYADSTFVNLGAADGGSLTFTVDIFAFNEDDYNAAESSSASVEVAVTSLSDFFSLRPTWSTTCTASQQTNIEVLAVCGPLATPSP